MIFGRHEIGDLDVEGPTSGDSAMTIRSFYRTFEMVQPEITHHRLTRTDVERLRDLCDEALS